MKQLRQFAYYLLVVVLAVVLIFGLIYFIEFVGTRNERERCDAIATISKYPVKFQGGPMQIRYCLLELAPGIWADDRSIVFETVTQ